MSKQQLLVPGEVITGAPVDALLATAHALLVAAAGKVREGTRDVPRGVLIDQAVACQQVQNTAWSVQSVRLAQVASIEEVMISGEGVREVRHPIGAHQDEWLPAEVATRLGWSDRQATNRLTEAIQVIRCTPGLFDLATAGVLDARKVSAVTDVLCSATPNAIRQVEAGLLTVIDQASQASHDDENPGQDAEDGASAGEEPGQDASDGDDQDAATGEEPGVPVAVTSTKLVRRARRLLAQVAPAEAEESAAVRRAHALGVQVYPHDEPGLSVLRAVLPTIDAMQVLAGVNELASHLHQDTTTAKGLDECRVDAFTDLLLGNVTVDTTCVLQIPVIPARTSAAGAGGAGFTPEVIPERPVTKPVVVSRATEPVFARLLRDTSRVSLDLLTAVGALETTPAGLTAGASGPARGDWSWRSPGDVQQLDSTHRTTSRHATSAAEQARVPGTRWRISDTVIEGIGVIPAAVLTHLCQTLGTTLTRALVDADTGATLESSDRTYRPSARVRRFVTRRDVHCRFPGCTRPAVRCDVDHVTPFPDGPTAAWNLQCLCRHHHRAKHETGWKVTMTRTGVCTWTSPSGRKYVTWPGD
ncbi:HNH endonuclease signature motif containing protein [Flexivirga caeni]|uniref:HNH endonuclease n=1 Tax=Flexivirga caeni TaxID=2294115 RepID=A0A3M9MAK1_9MICO|nr:HNH endonuclease signature motif containing protein [Flexivirga caeni]RNI22245.1 HNH endonuclease [Flexivirga caeni]